MGATAALPVGFYNKLKSVTTAGSVYAYVSGRIYQRQAPQDAALPLLVYQVITDLPWRFFGKADIEAEVQVTIYAKFPEVTTGTQLDTANDVLFTLLDGATLTLTGYAGAQAMCIDRGTVEVDQDSSYAISRWRVWANASA